MKERGEKTVKKQYEVIDLTGFFKEETKKSGIIEQAWFVESEEQKDLLIRFYPGIKQEDKNVYILAITQNIADIARAEEKKEESTFIKMILGMRIREAEQFDFEIIRDPKYRKERK